MIKKRLADLEAKCKMQEQTKWLYNPLIVFNYDSKDLNTNNTKYTIKYFEKGTDIHTDDIEGFYRDNNLKHQINCNIIELKVCKCRKEADFITN